MPKETLNIPNISCGHCVAAIEKELKGLPGVSSVTGTPETKTIEVQWEPPASIDIIKKKLEDIDYPPA